MLAYTFILLRYRENCQYKKSSAERMVVFNAMGRQFFVVLIALVSLLAYNPYAVLKRAKT